MLNNFFAQKKNIYIYPYVFVTIRILLKLFRSCFVCYHLERHIRTNTFGNKSDVGCLIILVILFTPTLEFTVDVILSC